MTLIKMINIYLKTQGPDSSYPSNAEHHLLRNPFFRKPSVKLSGNPGVFIFLKIGIQQIERVIIKTLYFPDPAVDIPFPDFNPDLNPGILQEIIAVNRITIADPTIPVYYLGGITLTPQDANPDNGIIQIPGSL